MISSGIRNLIHLLSVLLLLNVVLAVYETPYGHKQPYELNNQRSADSRYKYAWFTRDIHDDLHSGEEKQQQQQQELSPQRIFRLNTLKSVFNRKYKHPNNDAASLSESNEKL